MRALLTAIALMIAIAIAPATAYGASIGLRDTFQDNTTDNWFAGGLGLGMVPPVPPQVVATGGPNGALDEYLKITATGNAGQPGSRIVAINGTQWAGNYLASGISTIEMDLKNLGTTDLTIRLQFEDPMGGPPVDEAVTTFGAFLPAGSDWTHVAFGISVADLTAILGNPNTALGNTTLLRIIDSPTATDAVTIAGTLGVDNITASAVPEPATMLFTATGLVALAAKYRRRRAG